MVPPFYECSTVQWPHGGCSANTALVASTLGRGHSVFLFFVAYYVEEVFTRDWYLDLLAQHAADLWDLPMFAGIRISLPRL